MILELTHIADRGDLNKERLVMKASGQTDVGKFAIFRARTSDTGAPTSAVSETFWFPDKKIAAGDLVVLYTKAGKTSERQQEKGGTVYFYYWGKTTPMWKSDANHLPVLVHTADWSVLKA